MSFDGKLTTVQKIKLKLQGHVKVGEFKKESWSDSLPHYVFRCPTHGLVSDYPHGFKEKLMCPLCTKEELEGEPPREFLNNHGRTYRILDEESYERFWWGRKPSTRDLFEEWLFVPTATMNAVALRSGRCPVLLQRLSQQLQDLGIMDWVKKG